MLSRFGALAGRELPDLSKLKLNLSHHLLFGAYTAGVDNNGNEWYVPVPLESPQCQLAFTEVVHLHQLRVKLSILKEGKALEGSKKGAVSAETRSIFDFLLARICCDWLGLLKSTNNNQPFKQKLMDWYHQLTLLQQKDSATIDFNVLAKIQDELLSPIGQHWLQFTTTLLELPVTLLKRHFSQLMLHIHALNLQRDFAILIGMHSLKEYVDYMMLNSDLGRKVLESINEDTVIHPEAKKYLELQHNVEFIELTQVGEEGNSDDESSESLEILSISQDRNVDNQTIAVLNRLITEIETFIVDLTNTHGTTKHYLLLKVKHELPALVFAAFFTTGAIEGFLFAVGAPVQLKVLVAVVIAICLLIMASCIVGSEYNSGEECTGNRGSSNVFQKAYQKASVSLLTQPHRLSHHATIVILTYMLSVLNENDMSFQTLEGIQQHLQDNSRTVEQLSQDLLQLKVELGTLKNTVQSSQIGSHSCFFKLNLPSRANIYPAPASIKRLIPGFNRDVILNMYEGEGESALERIPLLDAPSLTF